MMDDAIEPGVVLSPSTLEALRRLGMVAAPSQPKPVA